MAEIHMTLQETLAALHQAYNAYTDLLIEHASAQAFVESAPLRDRALTAFVELTEQVHGKLRPGEMFLLCDGCGLHRAVRREQGGYYQNLCTACLAQTPALTGAPSGSASFEPSTTMNSLTHKERYSHDYPC